MPCNSPNRVFYIGYQEEPDKDNPAVNVIKRKTYFTSRHVAFLYRKGKHDTWHRDYSTDPAAIEVARKSYEVCTDYDDVPCGQCLGCRLDYSREWATRIMLEKKSYPDSQCWFLTLTYDDDHLHNSDLVATDWDPVTGEALAFKHKSDFYNLSMEDHQKFMKRLRYSQHELYGNKLRFFACGEYGSESWRPHYHYIVFGLNIPDLVQYKVSKHGHILYNSEYLSQIWNQGFVVIGRVTTETAAYVARYCIKKRKITDRETYEKLGILPEFVVMSRKPGIGKVAFDENYKKYYETGEIILPTDKGAVSVRPPHFFDTLLERLDPEYLDEIKDERKKKARQSEDFLAEYMPFLDKEVILDTRERQLLRSMKVLESREV